MKKIFNFVLTGGPCGGKSTAINKIYQDLSERGYKVLIVPETATELINSGITVNFVGSVRFQEILFYKQLKKEELYRQVASELKNDKVVILYDRGLVDGRAYMTQNVYESILKKFNTNEAEIKARYDGIFHLVTAADGKEEFYTTKNNMARTETLEEARNLDKKCIEAWVGHDKLKIIDNSTDFDEKINRLLSEIHFAIGDPLPIEIERKFLIKKPNIETISKLYPVAVCDIFQFWLTENSLNTDERRVRSYGIDNNYTYYYTVKKQYNEGRIEIEERISEKEFLRFLPDMKSKLSKKRYCIAYDSQYIKLDIFDFEQDLAIVEVELSDITNEVNLPEAFEVIKEVTNDENYLNKNIALRKMLEYY